MVLLLLLIMMIMVNLLRVLYVYNIQHPLFLILTILPPLSLSVASSILTLLSHISYYYAIISPLR
jgi:hypothetical protein